MTASTSLDTDPAMIALKQAVAERQARTPPLAPVAKEPIHATTLPAEDGHVAMRLTAETTHCSRCGAEHQSHFPRSLCTSCVESQRKRDAARLRALDDSWKVTFPPRALRDLRSMTGPALDKAREILPILEEPYRGPIILLIGDRWTGKTVMATWWASQLAEGTYVLAWDLFAEIKATYQKTAKETERDVIARYARSPYLVIDEAQERRESEWENGVLTTLADKRHSTFKRTVIIANLKRSALDTALGPSIIRRATQSGGVIETTWKPYGPH